MTCKLVLSTPPCFVGCWATSNCELNKFIADSMMTVVKLLRPKVLQYPTLEGIVALYRTFRNTGYLLYLIDSSEDSLLMRAVVVVATRRCKCSRTLDDPIVKETAHFTLSELLDTRLLCTQTCPRVVDRLSRVDEEVTVIGP